MVRSSILFDSMYLKTGHWCECL